MRYYLSQKGFLDYPIKETETLDEAFYQAKLASQKSPEAVFVVFNWGVKRGDPSVRAFALGGSAYWAEACTACQKTGCSYCNYIGWRSQ